MYIVLDLGNLERSTKSFSPPGGAVDPQPAIACCKVVRATAITEKIKLKLETPLLSCQPSTVRLVVSAVVLVLS